MLPTVSLAGAYAAHAGLSCDRLSQGGQAGRLLLSKPLVHRQVGSLLAASAAAPGRSAPPPSNGSWNRDDWAHFFECAICEIEAGKRDVGRANPNANGGTVLHAAAQHGNPEEVRRLLALGGDHSARDGHGNTPLHAACVTSNTATAAALLEAGADIEAAGKSGVTPLMVAASKGNTAMVRFLVGAGADPRKARWDGKTALHEALFRSKMDMVAVLVEAEEKLASFGRSAAAEELRGMVGNLNTGGVVGVVAEGESEEEE